MCIIWTGTYTRCGCSHDLATTTCPPELKHQCEGLRMMILDNNKVTCKPCWMNGDKRTLMTPNNEIDHDHDHSTSNSTSPSTTHSSLHSTSESDDPEQEVWYDSLEYIYSSADDDSHVFVEAVEHDFPDEPYEENKISPRESSQSVTSQTDESPEPNSKPATPCFDFNYPG